MRLSLGSLALAAALFWGLSFLFVAGINYFRPPYGLAFLEVMSSLYPGYKEIGTPNSIIVGTLYAFVDGGIAGGIFAGLYNVFSGK
jgi:multisubunit Na+/H+ antiporter MnhB subunit